MEIFRIESTGGEVREGCLVVSVFVFSVWVFFCFVVVFFFGVVVWGFK